MGIEDEGNKDLSLGAADAENVAGGARKRKAGHKVVHNPPAPSAPGTTNPAGLGMGPDPDYPNPDGGADDLDT
jgi:hypothetical protein